MMIKQQKTDHLIENQIVRNLILSTEYARKAFQIYNSEYMQNKYAKVIIEWIKKYFESYDESPKLHMADIFEYHKKDIKEDEYEYIETMLLFLQDETDEQHINHEYLYRQTEDYFQKRSYHILAKNLENASKYGTIEETQKIMSDFRTVERDLSGWIDPFNEIEIRKAFDSQDEQKLFRMPGKLGELMGDFKRSQLMIIMAPAKRGKTMMLQEVAVQAILNRYNVCFVSLEMNAERSKLRMYRRISGFSDNGEYRLPVFDCFLNQTGQCNMLQRKNKIVIRDDDGAMLPGSDVANYKPCEFCRKKNPKNFFKTTWYSEKKGHKFEYNEVNKKIKKIKKWYHPNLRFLNCRGKKMSQIVNSIKLLQQTEGFVPDVIIPDYFAIAAPENNNLQQRDKINNAVWIGKTLAENMNCLVFSGHQGNRASFDAKQIKQTHTSEDIRVLADVDGLFGLMQTDDEKKTGILRVSTLVSRDDNFIPSASVTMLCNFGIGQIHLDSEWT